MKFPLGTVRGNVEQLRVRPSPKAALSQYLADVYPARLHGRTDCGENLEGLSDADHMLQWLAERGIAVVGTRK